MKVEDADTDSHPALVSTLNGVSDNLQLAAQLDQTSEAAEQSSFYNSADSSTLSENEVWSMHWCMYVAVCITSDVA